MSKITEIINKKVSEYKSERNLIENLDLEEDVLYFFEETLLPLTIGSKNLSFTLTSTMLVSLFTEKMNAKYEVDFACLEPNVMFNKICGILETYAKEDECLHVLLAESDPKYNPKLTVKTVKIHLDRKVLTR